MYMNVLYACSIKTFDDAYCIGDAYIYYCIKNVYALRGHMYCVCVLCYRLILQFI